MALIGADDARLVDRPEYSPNTPRRRMILLTTLAIGSRTFLSAWMVTLIVSTGWRTMLTRVPAMAPATALALSWLPLPLPPSSLPLVSAGTGRSYEVGNAPS